MFIYLFIYFGGAHSDHVLSSSLTPLPPLPPHARARAADKQRRAQPPCHCKVCRQGFNLCVIRERRSVFITPMSPQMQPGRQKDFLPSFILLLGLGQLTSREGNNKNTSCISGLFRTLASLLLVLCENVKWWGATGVIRGQSGETSR